MTARLGPASPLSDAATSNSYSPPRTPWGDPDLQGAFSNSDERGIPMSRPDTLKHFSLQHFPPAQLAHLNQQRALQFHPEKNQWEEVHEPAQINNSRPWLMSDPPDGSGQAAGVRVSRRKLLDAQYPGCCTGHGDDGEA